MSIRSSSTRWPDRLRLPLRFDPARLAGALDDLAQAPWTAHFVTTNYVGGWSVIPLRAPEGTEQAHPILQMTSHPGAARFVDTPALTHAPYFAEVLAALDVPVGAARLMRLDPGAMIREHTDPDLDGPDGAVRLHVPIQTNAGVRFELNGTRVDMAPGECWYLRLSDPHAVRNDGPTPRIHLVVDAGPDPRVARLLERAVQHAARHRA